MGLVRLVFRIHVYLTVRMARIKTTPRRCLSAIRPLSIRRPRDVNSLRWRHVAKLFDDGLLYTGRIARVIHARGGVVDKATGYPIYGPLFAVTYDDGDREELEWHELQDCLVPAF